MARRWQDLQADEEARRGKMTRGKMSSGKPSPSKARLKKKLGEKKHGEKKRRDRKSQNKGPSSSNAQSGQDSYEKPENLWFAEDNSTERFAARVVEVHKRFAFVSSEPVTGNIDTSDVWLATVARRFLTNTRIERNFIAVGDRVLCEPTGNHEGSGADLPQCVIQHLAPRQSQIARLDPQTMIREHVLAANIDLVVVVASFLKPKVKWGLIDRYLVMAESDNIDAVIVLNKVDLLNEAKADFLQEVRQRMVLYRQLGYEVLEMQANRSQTDQDQNIKLLEDLLRNKISLLTGHSGVGKSSIVNLFGPELEQGVEPDEDIFYKGRHTTTFASFIKLNHGGYIIDTPGIRSFTFEPKSAVELTYCFVDLRPYLNRCKYRECRHVDEPECAVRSAVENGKIATWRYRSYLAILLGASGREGRLRQEDINFDET